MNQLINAALDDIERMQMQENARARVHALEGNVKLLVKRCKESEACLNAWGESELIRKGHNVQAVRDTINRVKAFCTDYGYSY